MKATPNVKTLLLFDDFNYSETNRLVNGFRVIVNNLTKLESFGWLISDITHHGLLYSLDVAMTGLPEEFCKEMSEKFRNKDHIAADELASYQLQRHKSSILDLKGTDD